MSDEKSSIKISLRDGQFEISGSEAFVSGSIELLRDIILATQRKISGEPTEASGDQDDVAPPAAPHQQGNGTNRFVNVLHIEGEKVSIIKALPSGTNAQKTVNAALLYMWGKKQAGVDSVSLTDIREVCKSLSCFDSANFASTIQSARANFILEGKKGSQSKTCKLTVPGVENAVRLLESMNA